MADKIFIPKIDGLPNMVAEIGGEIARQTEKNILAQLNEFISRGLLIVESTQPVFVREPDSTKLIVRTSVSLRLKDQEYIESLERQIKELNDLIAKLRNI